MNMVVLSSSLHNSFRPIVLALYKNILRTGQSWQAKDSFQTQLEKDYIQNEARLQFRKNSRIVDQEVIRSCIHEAEARLEIARHYRVPYPRPVYFPPKSLTGKGSKKPTQQKQRSVLSQNTPDNSDTR